LGKIVISTLLPERPPIAEAGYALKFPVREKLGPHFIDSQLLSNFFRGPLVSPARRIVLTPTDFKE